MCPVFDYAPFLHSDDAVAVAHAGEPMCNDDDRAAFDDFPHIRLYDFLALVIQRAGRFVED